MVALVVSVMIGVDAEAPEQTTLDQMLIERTIVDALSTIGYSTVEILEVEPINETWD